MKSSEILREAALLAERDGYCCGCDAIGRVANPKGNLKPPELVMKFFRLVGPAKIDPDETWWGSFGGVNYYTLQRNMDARIIGLCLAAAIAESEGD